MVIYNGFLVINPKYNHKSKVDITPKVLGNILSNYYRHLHVAS